ncbi:MAG TPA: DUF1549 and DUF1553 domain-containing protein [Gemmata sp.]|jgi:hypothetical protein|nr:DUF1549 and DUF1553 domain-containing protein [Gemmata sp.]
MRLLPRFSVIALLIALLLVPNAQGADLPGDWAYRPAHRPSVPQIPNQKPPTTNSIDAFLLTKLDGKKLTFAPEADRRTLIRRVYFDLIGLPPSPEEIEGFLADKSPDAYEKLVDRLLASPRYGERMAVWWLDVTRFAETDGFKADDPRPNAWRYRDYVIQSFNADKPFDRFVKEQLAGDELFPDDLDAVVATGFLRHFPDEYNAVNVEQRRQEILNDITDTTAATFLGITLGCCRCHNHKTDPIAQNDYYRFQAFFAGMWPVEALLLPEDKKTEYQVAQTAWETKTAGLRAAMAKIEEPYRTKDSQKQRGRFPDEYASLLDIPFDTRTPLQKQIAAMVEKQVTTRTGDVSKSMKPAEKGEWDHLRTQLAELSKDKPRDPPRAMAMTDLPVSPPTKLLKRGNWRNPGEELEPGFLATIDSRDAKMKTTTAGTPGRRAALAEWIASKDNPLTARVIVNRLWQHHFGKGLVASSSDFGVTGERPTHPELLDWLAGELIAPSRSTQPWSLKHIHRLIVTSTAYRQSAKGDPAGSKTDPENTLIWQFPHRRLDGEALRDAMLVVSSRLNLKAGGPSVFPDIPPELLKSAGANWKVTADPAERDRRSVYVFVKRNLRYPLFSLFDAPDRNETCSRRFATTTAPQALTLLNDAIVLGFAKDFATRVTKETGNDFGRVVDLAFEVAFGRPPTSEERQTMIAFLKNHKGTFAEATTDLCHVLLNLNEFLYVD